MTPLSAVSDIINDELSSTEFSDIVLRPNDIFTSDGDKYIYLNDFDSNFCTTILDRTSQNYIGIRREFYHFKTADKIINVLNQKTLLAANLPAHSDNDNQEYTSFARILGHDEWFEECQPEEKWFGDCFGHRRIDDWRGGVHILCVTKSVTDYMWNHYAGSLSKPATGACLVLGFEDFDLSEDERLQPLYQFRDVIYDNEQGNRFGFYKRIDDRVLSATGKRILFSRMPRYSQFHKRAHYKPEDEARLSFDWRYTAESYHRHLQNHYSITHYLSAPKPWGAISLPIFDISDNRNPVDPFFGNRVGLPSPGFKIIVKGIIYGANISVEDRRVISEILATKFPSAFIQRSALLTRENLKLNPS